MDVRVLERGGQQPVGKVDALGVGTDELAHLVVRPDCHDLAAPHGDGGRRLGVLGTGDENPTTGEHQLGVCHGAVLLLLHGDVQDGHRLSRSAVRSPA